MDSVYRAQIEEARPRLGPLASQLLHFDSIGSTNDIALEKSSAHLVVVADQQTAGRGRRGHRWFSPPRAGLYVSVVLAPSTGRIDPQRALMLTTIAAGVALAEAVDAISGLRVDLKWPNDLYVGRRKLGGILAERGRDDLVVIGYGINVAPAAFPPELADRATSLEQESGRAVDRGAVLVETLAALAGRYHDLLAGRFDAILDAWRDRAPSAVGARVTWTTNNGPATGITAGIAGDGALLVRRDDRVERIVAGEVFWH
jgi:BirA family transcriptional regulator, biotin operon repressor / biotin---[acetyl-CoA-carboxylase] ligase